MNYKFKTNFTYSNLDGILHLGVRGWQLIEFLDDIMYHHLTVMTQ